MKPTIFLIFTLYSTLAFSQIRTPEAYISFSGFYNSDLKSNTYFNLAAGAELFTYKFIAPEIDATFYFGSNAEESFSSWVGGLGPKLFLDDTAVRYALIPKYHWGNQASERDEASSENTAITQKATQKFNFWSFSLGDKFSGRERKGKTGIYLTYTGFDAGKTLNQLATDNQTEMANNVNTRAIGLTVRLLTGFSKHRKEP
ncbi:hypothetical protein [uncultured Croceitalea sp.]|uniref:hypothetical protein n=1 Tax=uncultured Croceitalea sp. TaxID=1798908 RepID=UPI00330611FF